VLHHAVTMKFISITAVAASVLLSAGLSAARVIIGPEKFIIEVLGGGTMRIPQVYNEHFIQLGRGPRAVGKVYQKFGTQFGISMPEDLTTLLLEIFLELQLLQHRKNNTTAGTNTTTSANQGM
jgi:hypothetical protein